MSPAEQLAHDLTARYTGPLAALCGDRASKQAIRAMTAAAPAAAKRIEKGDPGTAYAVIDLILGNDIGDGTWWTSPLGIAVASALVDVDTVTLTHTEAAQMLGVVKGTVSAFVSKGLIETEDVHGVRRVRRAAVFARIARRGVSRDEWARGIEAELGKLGITPSRTAAV